MKSRTLVFIILGVAGAAAVLWYAHLQRQAKTVEMRQALESEDYDEAREAVEWLTHRGRAVVPILNEIAAAEAEPPIARWRAAMMLGEINDRSSVDPLIEVLSTHLNLDQEPQPDQIAVAAAAAAALGRMGADKAVPQLTKLVAKDDAGLDLRCAAARALGRLKAKSAAQELAALLADHPPVPPKEEPDEEEEEAEETEEGEEEEAPEDPTIPLRIAACEALGAIGDTATVASLIAAADQEVEPDLTVRRAATVALGEIGAKDAISILAENLQDIEEEPAAEGDPVPDTDGDIRVAAAISLGQIGDPQARSALEAGLEDKHYWVRRAAERSLRELP